MQFTPKPQVKKKFSLCFCLLCYVIKVKYDGGIMVGVRMTSVFLMKSEISFFSLFILNLLFLRVLFTTRSYIYEGEMEHGDSQAFMNN
jgi:hypothetical protein